MQQDFEGGVYLGASVEICYDIARAAGFQSVMRLRGNMVYNLSMLNSCRCFNFMSERDIEMMRIQLWQSN